MIPLRDENPATLRPFVTRALIVANIAVFLYEILLGPDLQPFIMDWGLIPRRLTAAFVTGDESFRVGVTTILSSMFLHAGWAHLGGNLWYLWIFGDNIEDRMGHARFLGFYLASGVFAALVHYSTNPNSTLPTLGASGAIAGVLGAYLAAFPRARVLTLIPFFPFISVRLLPAALVLGFWFVFQFFTGLLALGWGAAGAGIAWWAHIGGFAFGWVVMRITMRRRDGGARWSG